MNIGQRLALLRNEMRQNGIDIYIVPSIDPHNSEYVPDCFERRSWISGFDGSVGEVVVTMEDAYLWTDGRYFLQASLQLDHNHYTLMKQDVSLRFDKWLLQNASNKSLGVDSHLISIARADKLTNIMHDIQGQLILCANNLVDICKNKSGEITKLPNNPAFSLSIEYTGQSLNDNLELIRSNMYEHAADYLILNVLDEIAWLFNLRGTDIKYNPLVITNAFIGTSEAWLFIANDKIPSDLLATFKQSKNLVCEYNEFGDYISRLNGNVWLDSATANYWMLDKISNKSSTVFMNSPIVLAKACKNNIQINGACLSHIKDATAVIKFLCWLDNNHQNGLTELSCAEKLAEFRSTLPNIQGASFNTISGFGSNSAIIHYRVTPSSNKIVDNSNIYLVDSGAQYLEGTTDITRTVHLGSPTNQQIHHYTLVLKGHLALARAVFPHGTMGENLDVLARSSLWSECLDYRHGTGHGVGSFLCVHEGPHRISQGTTNVPLLPGMIVSNEPGFYIDGCYGIRIENLCLVEALDKQKSDYGIFYRFKTLTLVPYCKQLMNMSMLSTEDKLQLTQYYADIKDKIRPNLSASEQQWLDAQLSL